MEKKAILLLLLLAFADCPGKGGTAKTLALKGEQSAKKASVPPRQMRMLSI